MARQASVRVKNGRWYSEAGGVGRYLGRVDQVSRAEAMAALWRALAQSDANSKNLLDNECDGMVESRRRQAKSIKPLACANGDCVDSGWVGGQGQGQGHKPLAYANGEKPKASAKAKSLKPKAPGIERNAPGKERKEGINSPAPPASKNARGKERKEGINSSAPAIATAPPRVNSFQEFLPDANANAEGIRHAPPHHTPTLSTLGQEQAPTPTVQALAEAFLDWVLAHRGEKAHRERSRHLNRFCEAFGGMEAIAIGGTQIEAFTATLRASGHAPDYINKHLVSVGAMFNKGVRKGWLPASVKPFASVEPLRLPPKALTEDALPTPAEIEALFASADADAYGQMGDVVRLYYNTGARTHELINARVGDYQPNARTIVLAHHKRSHTMREPRPRTITLNDTAVAIVRRRCEGREPSAPIFPRPSDGEAYSNVNIAERFQNVRRRAGVRPAITFYSFRHLWISEALMAGLDALLVARMAGTSVKMIETVYGHFRTQSLADAQARLDASRNCS